MKLIPLLSLLLIALVSIALQANNNCYDKQSLEKISQEVIDTFGQESFIASYKRMLSLPDRYARFVYSELTNSMQKRIWLYHTEQFVEHETLNSEQLAYISEYKLFIAELFEDDPFGTLNIRIESEKKRAEKLLGKTLSHKLINDLFAYYGSDKLIKCSVPHN